MAQRSKSSSASPRTRGTSVQPAPREPRTRAAEAALARLRSILLPIPGAFEKLSHGEPTWFTGEKGRVFAMFDDHHHGAPHVAVWIATPVEVQQALIAAEPSRYFVPPYVGVRGWVGAVLDVDPDWDAVERLARAAFRLVAKPRSVR